MERIALRYFVVLSLSASLAACGTAEDASLPATPASQGQAIINGEPTKTGDYPSTGALLMRDYDATGAVAGSLCTGTLIAPDTVLTAAHCVGDNAARRRFYFFLGNDARTPMGVRDLDPGPDLHEAAAVVRHDRFRMQGSRGLGKAHDIALVFLREPILHVEPSMLLRPDESRQLEVGTALDIVGFGVRTPPELGGHPEEQTGEKYHARSVVGELNRQELQAGTWMPTPQKCHGDSGGPSFIRTARGARLVGVTSRAYDTHGCTRGGVDTRADAYYTWITQTMQRGCDEGIRTTCYPLP